jgi:hypothetical protein
MEDMRITTVTELLRKHRDLSSQLLEILSPEIISYETLRNEHDRKRAELKTLEDQKTLVNVEIEKAKETAGSIIQLGKDEAQSLVNMAKTSVATKMQEVNRLLDSVKQLAIDVEKKRYNKIMDEKEKLEKAA